MHTIALNLDIELLREQIETLATLVADNFDTRHELNGVVTLLEEIIDQAEGFKVAELPEVEQIRRGQLVADVLMLRRKLDNGRVDTTWGDKTEKGLYLTIKRILERGE